MTIKTSRLKVKSAIVETDNFPKVKSQNKKFDQLLTFLPFNFKFSKPVVSVLRLNGIIGKGIGFKSALNLENLNEIIEKTFKTPKLEAVCLCINSPGGSPVQSELIAKRIRALANEKGVPVYSFVEDVAASGGYWLACAGDRIYASQSSLIGSIGVISSSFGFHEALKKLGVERRVYTQGKNKSVLDPFMPTKQSDIKIIKQLQKQIHEHFINYVKERRSGKLTQDDEILFNGEFWAGETALDFGLIDGINDMHSFINENFGNDTKIEYIATKQPWLKRKLGITQFNFAEDFSEALINKLENKINKGKFDF